MGDGIEKIGRYEIERKIGRGGMAVVYLARDPKLDRPVAIKLIRKGAFPPEQLAPMMERFRREAMALAKLNHANIVKIMDYGDHEGAPYLVMEYIEGATLKEVKKPLRVETAARLIRPIAEALAYVHGQGLLHRDVKPSNIMLTKDQRVILTDFGIAKWIEDDENQATLTGTGVGIGTPEYMAPEQGRGQRVDERTDLYSLTVVFYELITGVKPYSGDTAIDILVRQATEPVPDPRQYVPELSESVKRFLDRAMAKKPEDRYPAMADYLRDLDGLRLQSLAQASTKQMTATEIRARPAGEDATGSSVRFGKTAFRRVREAVGVDSKPTASGQTEKNRGGRMIPILITAVVVIMAAIGFTMIRGGNPFKSVSTAEPSPTAAATLASAAESAPTVLPSESVAMLTAEEASAAQRTPAAEKIATFLAAVSLRMTATNEMPAAQATQMAAMQGTAAALNRQATEQAAVLISITEQARQTVSALETQIAVLSRTATYAVSMTEASATGRRPAATATAASRNPYANVKAGATIDFGRYEQDNNTSNGPESIAWTVLAVSDGSALVISRYGLERIGYHGKYTDVTWETCDLREWLAGEFYENAFTAEEKRLVETTRVVNRDNPETGTVGGNDTDDKVFILSLEEAIRYFSDNRSRIGKPTYYAEGRGAWTSKESGYAGNSWWWLRSGGLDARQAARIFPGGAPDYHGAFVNDDRGVVRPALRIRLGDINP